VPFLLLLLDFWPLQRLRFTTPGSGCEFRSSMLCLVREKLPFFALSFLSSAITWFAQHRGGAVSEFKFLPIGVRIGNAFLSYMRYIGKTFWPADLIPIYPLFDHLPWLLVIGAALAIFAASAFILARRNRQPYLLTGWFW